MKIKQVYWISLNFCCIKLDEHVRWFDSGCFVVHGMWMVKQQLVIFSSGCLHSRIMCRQTFTWLGLFIVFCISDFHCSSSGWSSRYICGAYLQKSLIRWSSTIRPSMHKIEMSRVDVWNSQMRDPVTWAVWWAISADWVSNAECTRPVFGVMLSSELGMHCSFG